jgi:hypothetical protein
MSYFKEYFLGYMGGHQNKSETDKGAQKRYVVLETIWWKHIRKVMKKYNKLR